MLDFMYNASPSPSSTSQSSDHRLSHQPHFHLIFQIRKLHIPLTFIVSHHLHISHNVHPLMFPLRRSQQLQVQLRHRRRHRQLYPLRQRRLPYWMVSLGLRASDRGPHPGNDVVVSRLQSKCWFLYKAAGKKCKGRKGRCFKLVEGRGARGEERETRKEK